MFVRRNLCEHSACVTCWRLCCMYNNDAKHVECPICKAQYPGGRESDRSTSVLKPWEIYHIFMRCAPTDERMYENFISNATGAPQNDNRAIFIDLTESDDAVDNNRPSANNAAYQCAVCFNDDRMFVTLEPCRHVVCTICVPRLLGRCHQCRSEFSDHRRIFLN